MTRAHGRLLVVGTVLLLGVTACSTASRSMPADDGGAAITTGPGGPPPTMSTGPGTSVPSSTTPGSTGHPAGPPSSTRTPAGRPSSGARSTAKQEPVLDKIAGSAKHTCVAVGSQRDVRSDSMAGGPFDQALHAYAHASKPESAVRLYWIPMHGASTARPLTVTMTRLSSAAAMTRTVRQTEVSEAGRWSFFDTQLPIAAPGTWQFRVRAGADTGCFTAKFSR